MTPIARFATLALVLGLAAPLGAADDAFPALDFEGGNIARLPPGWHGNPPGTVFNDDKRMHGGAGSVRLERDDKSVGGFTGLTGVIPMNFAGKTIELHGWLCTEGVKGRAGLWLREDSDAGSVEFDNMDKTRVSGTTAWVEYSIQLPIDPKGRMLYFGALLAGTGKVWVDDMRILVDGKPVQSVPKVEPPRTPLMIDHEFDSGSKIAIDKLTAAQIANLTTLGKVWGFLKYHHPKIAGGERHWDYDLFRVMPRVLAAADADAARKVMVDWVKALGDVPKCDPCATLPDGLAIRPDVAWIHDKTALGAPLSTLLEQVYVNRWAKGDQAYVDLADNVRNPEFLRELRYAANDLPDAGFRILALYRWWNVVRYWSPYRDVIGADWDAVLPEFLPRLVAANDTAKYRLEMFAMIARLNDGHANMWRNFDVRPPAGTCAVPVVIRPIEGKPIVAGYTNKEAGPASGLKVGDAIVAVDGTPIDKLTSTWPPYYCASNDVARFAAMMISLTQGPCGPIKLTVERAGAKQEVATERKKPSESDEPTGLTHDLAGPAFRKLSNDVAYLKLSAIKVADVPQYLKGAEGTKGWIVDIRNYPSDFSVFALGGHFVDKPTPFVRFTSGDLSNPGAFSWSDPLKLDPLEPLYKGKVVVLVDEASISQAEYTAMAFRSAPGAKVVGSTTDGADGNVSRVYFPGDLQTLISGIGVFYPDKKPTQRVGIIPDVIARPTVAGFREGRDEVLEAAIKQIVPEIDEKTLREMAKR